MEFKEKIEKAVKELLADEIVEKLIGVDLPDDQVNQIVDAIKARIKLDKVGDALGTLGGLFGKK